jgi:hypothetical protein
VFLGDTMDSAAYCQRVSDTVENLLLAILVKQGHPVDRTRPVDNLVPNTCVLWTPQVVVTIAERYAQAAEDNGAYRWDFNRLVLSEVIRAMETETTDLLSKVLNKCDPLDREAPNRVAAYDFVSDVISYAIEVVTQQVRGTT